MPHTRHVTRSTPRPYDCAVPNEARLSVREASRRLNIDPSAFHRRYRNPNCPEDTAWYEEVLDLRKGAGRGWTVSAIRFELYIAAENGVTSAELILPYSVRAQRAPRYVPHTASFPASTAAPENGRPNGGASTGDSQHELAF